MCPSGKHKKYKTSKFTFMAAINIKFMKLESILKLASTSSLFGQFIS